MPLNTRHWPSPDKRLRVVKLGVVWPRKESLSQQESTARATGLSEMTIYEEKFSKMWIF